MDNKISPTTLALVTPPQKLYAYFHIPYLPFDGVSVCRCKWMDPIQHHSVSSAQAQVTILWKFSFVSRYLWSCDVNRTAFNSAYFELILPGNLSCRILASQDTLKRPSVESFHSCLDICGVAMMSIGPHSTGLLLNWFYKAIYHAEFLPQDTYGTISFCKDRKNPIHSNLQL